MSSDSTADDARAGPDRAPSNDMPVSAVNRGASDILQDTLTSGRPVSIRQATLADAPGVASILAQAFPDLYRATFGDLGSAGISALLASLYGAGHLSLETTLVAERDRNIVGVAILHYGQSIGRGAATAFIGLMVRRIGVWRAIRAVFGSLAANAYLNRRIPRAPDLAYIEALAVEESDRGTGIGSRLLRTAMETARGRQRQRIALHVLQSNAGARRLYERMGFHLWEMGSPRPRFRRRGSQSPGWASDLMVRKL